MHHPDGDDVAATLPSFEDAGSQLPNRYFRNANPTAGEEATVLTRDFLNDLLINLEWLRDQAGETWTKGRKEDLFDALLEILDSRRAADGTRLEWQAADELRLHTRGADGSIRIKLAQSSYRTPSPIAFLWPEHVLPGQEVAEDVFIHAYLSRSGSTVSPVLSTRDPVGSRHPELPDSRYVGSAFRESSRFTPHWTDGANYYLREIPDALQVDLGAQSSTVVKITTPLPEHFRSAYGALSLGAGSQSVSWSLTDPAQVGEVFSGTVPYGRIGGAPATVRGYSIGFWFPVVNREVGIVSGILGADPVSFGERLFILGWSLEVS